MNSKPKNYDSTRCLHRGSHRPVSSVASCVLPTALRKDSHPQMPGPTGLSRERRGTAPSAPPRGGDALGPALDLFRTCVLTARLNMGGHRWYRIRLPMQEMQVRSLIQEDPLKKETETHSKSSCLESRTESGVLQSMGSQSRTRLSN